MIISVASGVLIVNEPNHLIERSFIMKEGRIAVPSVETAGLDGQRSGHFGHCDVFTLVDMKYGFLLNCRISKMLNYA